jgi:Rrf2 family protein
MQITQTADYAVRTVVYLALHGNGGPVAASVIAKEMMIPGDYISKVIQALARAGLVESIAGRNGGAQLARTPAELSMLGIVEAVDGPVALTRCVIRPGACPRDTYCVVHGFWQLAQDGLIGLLSKTTIADICRSKDGEAFLRAKREKPGD